MTRPARNSSALPAKKSGGTYWMYGRHAIEAASDNPQRQIRRVLFSGKQAPSWLRAGLRAEAADGRQLERLVGAEAVHQGIIAEVDPLPQPHLEELLPAKAPLLLLDQVTDPHNIGAMLRTAAAFGMGAIVLPKDGAPSESAVMAKAACGALERVPLISVTNLASSMEKMKEAGYWLVGMDGKASQTIEKIGEYRPVGLVMGAEGTGLRRLTEDKCDLLMKINIKGCIDSLNVSNAAAIACHMIFQKERL